MFTGNSTLTADDADAIKAECPAVAYVSPTVRAAGQIVAGELNWGTSIQGVERRLSAHPLLERRRGHVLHRSGREERRRRSASSATTVADNLFPHGEAVGQIVRIKNVPFKVVGVLEKKGGNMMGQDQDDTVVAPYTTVMKRLSGKTKIDMIQVSAASADQVQEAQNEIDALLRQRHRIPPDGDADFQMRSQEEIAAGAGRSRSAILRMLLLVDRRDLAARRRHRHHEHHAGRRSPSGRARSASAWPSARRGATCCCSSSSRRSRCRSSAA